MSPAEPLRVGVLSLARPTFDVPFAEQVCADAWKLMEQIPVDWVGSGELLFDAESVESQLTKLKKKPIDLLLIMQLTFTDATMTVKIAESFDVPLLFWSFPEKRTGGRLRLNSLCGVNLAAHALGKSGIQCDYINLSPNDPETSEDLSSWIRAFQTRKNLSSTKIAVIGKHPDGFHTCAFDSGKLKEISGVTVEQMELTDLFDEAEKIEQKTVNLIRSELDSKINGLELVEQEPLEKSIRILSTLRKKAESEGYQGFSVRCWPEFFTEYGCAACGAMGVLNSQGIASGCEADVYGTISTLILNWLGGEPSFIADLVDIDNSDDTGVFWHCGLAPLNMADPDASVEAGIHSNRKKPLVNEFALKPGEVTLFRLSQSLNLTRMVIGKGKMLKAPKSFSGTSGVIRFDKPASQVMDTVISEGLEHHYAITYSKVDKLLRILARQLKLPVLELT
ncbi:MAG: L-fucose/L-arabinose isomerase family protein [SAR324 cluster bacterium]|jgi:L-fucose isomerase-like protein|nr:L-fucose/L-arabinose isomerase family protein [SAR324 cluster bacterium]|tara:strand:- start:597 stop:1946 length:1350 start_codon:yes stop_codon:yes gene_type:complete